MFYKLAHIKRIYTQIKKPNRGDMKMSPSQLKTILKLKGFNPPKDFFKNSVLRKGNRYYRFRWNEVKLIQTESNSIRTVDSKCGFVVDISCPEDEFDRWANSTERTIPLNEFLNQM